MSATLAGCGSDNAVPNSGSGNGSSGATETSKLSGQVAGAGASSQESAMKVWLAGFQSKNRDVQITYDSVGSGAGVNQFISKQVSWAGSDKALGKEGYDKAKVACGSPAWNLPVYISPIVVIFNVPGVKSLNLDAATIASIFAGKITKWNDAAITKQNPDAKLPDLTITPVHRADKSGTTFNFTDYLHSAAAQQWPAKPTEIWPIKGGESGDKTSGLVNTVQSGSGTIGYADASQVGNLGTVALKVGGGYTKFSAEAAAKAADAAKPSPIATGDNDLALAIDRDPKVEGAYPLILISYEIVCSKYEDASKAKLVKAFMHYITSKDGQDAAAKNAGSSPISDALRSKLSTAIDAIK